MRRAKLKFPTLLVEYVDRAAVGCRKLHCLGYDGGQHHLQVERRIDRLADLAKCLQLFDGSRKLFGSSLHLVEKPDVLDGDHGLIGKGGEQLDLLVGEGPYRATRQPKYSN